MNNSFLFINYGNPSTSWLNWKVFHTSHGVAASSAAAWGWVQWRKAGRVMWPCCMWEGGAAGETENHLESKTAAWFEGNTEQASLFPAAVSLWTSWRSRSPSLAWQTASKLYRWRAGQRSMHALGHQHTTEGGGGSEWDVVLIKASAALEWAHYQV